MRAMLPHAEAASRELGVAPQTLIAHAALETGWGRSMPSGADGQPSFNLFGVKAGTGWQGPAVRSSTVEFEAGVAGTRVERFRAYDSPAASFGDYVALLKGASSYAAALGTGNDAGGIRRRPAEGRLCHRPGLCPQAHLGRRRRPGDPGSRSQDRRPIADTAARTVELTDPAPHSRGVTHLAQRHVVGTVRSARLPARARYDQSQHRQREYGRLRSAARRARHAAGLAVLQRLGRQRRRRTNGPAHGRRVPGVAEPRLRQHASSA